MVSEARKAEVSIFFENPHGISYEASPEILKRTPSVDADYLTQTQDILEETDRKPAKVTLVSDADQLLLLEARLRRSDRPIHITYSGSIFLEITRTGVNKGSALRRLAEYLQLPRDRIIAIGDTPNDRAMFAFAGKAIAMGNASAEVKESADIVAPSNNQSGVARVLHEIMEGRI